MIKRVSSEALFLLQMNLHEKSASEEALKITDC